MHEQSFEFRNKHNERLVGNIHHPNKPTDKAVIVLYGFGGNKEKCWVKDMCTAVSRIGISGVRMDFAGYGQSEGRFEEATYLKIVQDILSCMDTLELKGFKRFGIIGHSMSGANAILAGAQDDRIKAVVNIAGVAYPAVEEHINLVRDHFKNGFDKPIPSDEFIEKLKSVNVIEAVKRLHVPILTIHGDADETVPISEGEAINEAANEPKKMIIAIGCGHRLSQDALFAAECIELSVEWVKKYLASKAF